VAAKQALNRRLQDAALGRLAHRICVKAEEAGRRIWLVDPKNTSRCCAACGHTDPANRKTRDRFCCRRCGWADHADLNAAVVIATRGQTAEAAWQANGAPLLSRPTPRLRRRNPSTSGTTGTAAKSRTLTGTRGRAGSGAARLNAQSNG
jgi:putative transposase